MLMDGLACAGSMGMDGAVWQKPQTSKLCDIFHVAKM
jgi:hypothetical protein